LANGFGLKKHQLASLFLPYLLLRVQVMRRICYKLKKITSSIKPLQYLHPDCDSNHQTVILITLLSCMFGFAR